MRGYTPRSGRLPTSSDRRTILPADGRHGPPPPWPLPGEPSLREAEVWETLWRRPQALVWETQSMADDVALYVRRRVEAEQPGASAAAVRVLLQLADHLLLTLPALIRAGYVIGSDEPPSPRPGTAGPAGPPRGGNRPPDGRFDEHGRRRSMRERFPMIAPAAPAEPAPWPDFDLALDLDLDSEADDPNPT